MLPEVRKIATLHFHSEMPAMDSELPAMDCTSGLGSMLWSKLVDHFINLQHKQNFK